MTSSSLFADGDSNQAVCSLLTLQRCCSHHGRAVLHGVQSSSCYSSLVAHAKTKSTATTTLNTAIDDCTRRFDDQVNSNTLPWSPLRLQRLPSLAASVSPFLLPSRELPSSAASTSPLLSLSSSPIKLPLMLPHRSSFWQTVLSSSSPTSISDAPACIPTTKSIPISISNSISNFNSNSNSNSNSLPSTSACLHSNSHFTLPSHPDIAHSNTALQVTNSLVVQTSTCALPCQQDAERGHAERGHAERGHAERGHAEHGHAERGHAEHGHAEHGQDERGLIHENKGGIIDNLEKRDQQVNTIDGLLGCHVTDMNVMCDVCGVSFRKQGHLNMHWRSVHGRDYSLSTCALPTTTCLGASINHTQVNVGNDGNITREGVSTGLSLALAPLSPCRPSCIESLSSTPLVLFEPDRQDGPRHQLSSNISVPGLSTLNGDGVIVMEQTRRMRSTSPTCPPTPTQITKSDGNNDTNDISVDENHGSGNIVSERSTERGTVEGRVSKTSRAYTCPQCGASFRRGSDRNRHMRMVHAKIRPFECELCQKHFGRKSFLEAHVLTVHHKMRPFQCECGAAFGQRSSLTRHARKIHGREPS